MLGAITKLPDGGVAKSIESIATEWIETTKETAEAKAIMVKTLDPNGLMRRDLSNRVAFLYTVYLLTMLALLIIEFACGASGVDITKIGNVTSKITDLFLPITSLFGIIVTASFGVNYANVKGSK